MPKDKEQKRKKQMALSRPLAPEDVGIGDYVVVTHDTVQVLMENCLPGATQALQLARVRYIPYRAGWPYRVVSVCVPFVIVQDFEGDVEHLDLRQHSISRVDKHYFLSARRRYRKTQKARK